MESGNILYMLAEGVIYLTTLLLTIYAIILGYHWFSYGSSQKTSVTALTVFVVGSIVLILCLVTSYNFL